MSFMQPEVWQESYWEIESANGTDFIPCSVCDPDLEQPSDWNEEERGEWTDSDEYEKLINLEFRDCLDGGRCKVYSAERKEGWLARLSAPGYLDCTDTSAFETELEALEYLLDMYADGDPQYAEDWESAVRERIAKLSQQDG